MKSILIFIALVTALFAEPSFQQIQSLIETQNYKQAKFALQLVIANHPNSSKAYYTLAQAEAGLGNLPAAQEALTHAKAFNSSLDFVPVTQLEKLEQAITPQTHLIKPVESPSSFVILYFLVVVVISGVVWYLFIRKFKPASKSEQPSTKYSPTYTPSSKPYSTTYTSTARYTPSQTSYVDPTPSKPEVHHHYHSDSGMGTAGTILTAGLTTAAVTSMMDHSQSAPIVTPVYPEYTSSSWEDSKPSYTSTHSSDYEDSTSRSSSWSDSSSSSSSSWSDSSSSSSSWD